MTTVPASDTEPPTVRPATRSDLLAIHRIEKASFPQPWPFSAFESYVGEPGFLVAAADDDDVSVLLGYVVADTVPNHGTPLGHVKDLAVAPDYRGQGVGRTLLERAVEVLESVDAGSVKLEVRITNEAAISLYRSFEFEHRRTIPNYYGNGEDALVMMRTLDPE
ncbi:ribosomal-protein-alanine N-acetyltransferase [Halobacteriales archaeon QS_4_62_28]|nr:MAG: ribosomal-protein-alanine N-acetyltransferase [Halobacteriales archaeon QS_4_62_28]